MPPPCAGVVSLNGNRDRQPRKPAADSTSLSSGKAAAIANVSRQASGNAIRQKRLPSTKINGRYKISRQDLDQWRATQPGQRACLEPEDW
jgi:excisionase family DNA binding protein